MGLFSRSALVGMALGVGVLGVLEATDTMPNAIPDWQTVLGTLGLSDDTQTVAAASDVPVSPPLPDNDFNTMPLGQDTASDSLTAQALSIFSPYLLGNPDKPPAPSATQLYPPQGPNAAADLASLEATPPNAADPTPPAPRLPIAKAPMTAPQPVMRTLKSLRESNESPAMFNEAQIASIRARLKLSRQQEQYWPPVEAALRGVSWRREGREKAKLDLGSLQRLNEAARTMLGYLREDQKSEVKMLASIVGLKI